jgi:phosphate transport system substrate-binding protein
LIDQVPMEIPIARQGARLANAIAAVGEEVPISALQRAVRQLDGARRLTTTFRFRDGATRLDPLSEDNLSRLVRDLDAGLYAKREIILAGFSDGQGPLSANRDISLARAEAVRNALAEAVAEPDALRLVARGFGEVLPLACDDTDWGRQANRRVEVWVR